MSEEWCLIESDPGELIKGFGMLQMCLLFFRNWLHAQRFYTHAYTTPVKK